MSLFKYLNLCVAVCYGVCYEKEDSTKDSDLSEALAILEQMRSELQNDVVNKSSVNSLQKSLTEILVGATGSGVWEVISTIVRLLG